MPGHRHERFDKALTSSAEAVVLGREIAHDLVYGVCRVAVKQKCPLRDLLREQSEINKHLDRTALARLRDPVNCLGQSGGDGGPGAEQAALTKKHWRD